MLPAESASTSPPVWPKAQHATKPVVGPVMEPQALDPSICAAVRATDQMRMSATRPSMALPPVRKRPMDKVRATAVGALPVPVATWEPLT